MPNRRTRSRSVGSRVGNVWSRRVSMMDGGNPAERSGTTFTLKRSIGFWAAKR